MLVLCSLVWYMGVATVVDACTFMWDPVMTYMDGTPAADVKYRVYFQPVASASPQRVADTDQVSATMVCPAGTYWVTAYTPVGMESGKSNTVSMQQAAVPNNLKWSK